MSAAQQLSIFDVPPKRVEEIDTASEGLPAERHIEAPAVTTEDPASIALEIMAELGAAETAIGEMVAELAPRTGDFGDRIKAVMDRQIARAKEDEQELRALHAEILGCTIDELDERVAADKAKEKAEREAWKAQRTTQGAAGREASKGTRARKGVQPGNRIALSPTEKEELLPVDPPTDGARLPTQRLNDRERELLQLLRVEGQLAIYTLDELIPDWSLLKRIMTALGGKWKSGGKKAKGGFLFADDVDAREQVRLALETGEILDPRAAGFFETPDSLADRTVGLLKIQPGDRVLEPSAGRGRLARAVLRAQPTARLLCVELLPDNAKALRAEGFDVVEKDFLSIDPKGRDNGSDPETNGWNDAIVMNPPFAKAADVAHVTHALGFLKPAGSLVAIMSAGVLYRDDRVHREFREQVDAYEGRFEENPEGSFLESGTGVRTVTLVIGRSTEQRHT